MLDKIRVPKHRFFLLGSNNAQRKKSTQKLCVLFCVARRNAANGKEIFTELRFSALICVRVL